MHSKVIIIGAGPIGLACGIELEKSNIDYQILDKGCLVNSIYNYPANMTFFSTSDRLEIGGVPFISHNPKPTRPEALEYYRRVTTSWNLKVNLYTTIHTIKATDPGFDLETSKGAFTCDYLILATGFYDIPYSLNVPGESLPKVKHYYDDPHPYFGMKVIVIGAANSAVDVALETYRKGAKEVTMIIRDQDLRSSVKYWVLPDIKNRIKEGTIKAHFGAEVIEILEDKVVVQKEDGQQISIDNDFVLAMTGYQPDFSLLKSLGVHIGDDKFQTPFYNAETMETNVPKLFLAGVICGGLKTNQWFIENSRIHAAMIGQCILSDIQRE